MTGRVWIILGSILGIAIFTYAVALAYTKNKEKSQHRAAFIAHYMEQCSKDNPRYECELRVELLRSAWRAERSADDAALMSSIAAATAASGAAISAASRR